MFHFPQSCYCNNYFKSPREYAIRCSTERMNISWSCGSSYHPNQGIVSFPLVVLLPRSFDKHGRFISADFIQYWTYRTVVLKESLERRACQYYVVLCHPYDMGIDCMILLYVTLHGAAPESAQGLARRLERILHLIEFKRACGLITFITPSYEHRRCHGVQ